MRQHEIWMQPWVECAGLEERPDGFSLHILEKHAEYFRKNHLNGMPQHMPEIYSIPKGKVVRVSVDEQTYEQVCKGRFGARFDQFRAPGGRVAWIIRTKT